MLNGPPKKLRVGQLPAYILEAYQRKITRLTASNWVKVGRRSKATREQMKLKTASYTEPVSIGGRPAAVYTTSQWVDQFLQETTTWE